MSQPRDTTCGTGIRTRVLRLMRPASTPLLHPAAEPGIPRGDAGKQKRRAGVLPSTACHLLACRPTVISRRPLASGNPRPGCLPVTYASTNRGARPNVVLAEDRYAFRTPHRKRDVTKRARPRNGVLQRTECAPRLFDKRTNRPRMPQRDEDERQQARRTILRHESVCFGGLPSGRRIHP